jgi:hypothetical protein
MAPAMLLLLSILLGVCDGDLPSQRCNGNKQELAKKVRAWFLYLSTCMCTYEAKRELAAAYRLTSAPTSASNGVTIIKS